MRAVQISQLEGPAAAQVVDLDEPAYEGLVVIDIHAAGVAFPDVLQSRGLYQHKPELPFVPGGEAAGVVRSAPADAHVRPGDRVAVLTMLNGGMAQVIAVPAAQVFKLPDRVSFEAGCRAAVQRSDGAVRADHARAADRRRHGAGARRRRMASAPRRCDWPDRWGRHG